MGGSLPDRYWSIHDLEGLDLPEGRHEIVDGRLVMSPPPTARHELIVFDLGRWLFQQLDPRRVVALGNVGVGSESLYRIPDLCLVTRDTVAADQRLIAAQDVLLAVEVISPSETASTLIRKVDVYRRLGVGQVWLLDPQAREIGVMTQADGWSQTSVAVVDGIRLEPDPAVLFG